MLLNLPYNQVSTANLVPRRGLSDLASKTSKISVLKHAEQGAVYHLFVLLSSDFELRRRSPYMWCIARLPLRAH
jgi:hypothetical protein